MFRTLQSLFARYGGAHASTRPGHNPLTDYEVAVDGAPGGVDYAEAIGGTFILSRGGPGKRGSIYNGFDDVADAEA